MPRIKIQNIKCYIPPVGKVRNFHTKELEDRPILKRSNSQKEQYWERTRLPIGWRKKRIVEKVKQQFDPDYIDVELEEFRRQEWDRRLNGVWFLNNGRPEFLTPLAYFYLNWWKIDIGYPDFRKTDWEYFIFMDEVIRDKDCGGAIEVTKRRAGKCFNPDTYVRMYNGTSLQVKDIFDGMKVMGDNNAPRTVSGKTTGTEEMFKILPNRGEGYECNRSHILHCVKAQSHEHVNISVDDYLKLSEYRKKSLLMRRSGYDLIENDHMIDPYFIGAWLGDGSSGAVEFTNIDKEFIDYLYGYSEELKIPIHYNGDIRYSLSKPTRLKIKGTYNGKYYEFESKRDFMREFNHHPKSPFTTCGGKGQLKEWRHGEWEVIKETNHVRDEFKRLNLLNNKHIPAEYMTDSLSNRLKLLAGLIDTDGTLSNKGKIYKIVQSAEKKLLIDQINELANSCGFATSINYRDYEFPYYEITISGDIHNIPCKIERKKARNWDKKYNPLVTGFKVESIGMGDYAGFEVDDNHLFLLKDGTVVHNTARSGVFIYEYISRTKNAYGGAQSKTNDDVKKNVFDKFIIQPFKHLPDFFRPTYDTSKGITPTSELRFFHATKKGKEAETMLDVDELESFIDYAASNDKAYDGSKKHRYVSDESAKLPAEHDVYERNEVLKRSIEEAGTIIGKILHTTTVEEMGGKDKDTGKSMKMGGVKFKELWKHSDPSKRNENGRTISWLYQFFIPAYRTIYFDKYGYADEKKAMQYYVNERKAVEHDSRKLNSVIRKAPFTIEEAFRADSDSCLYNAMNLNDRLDFFSYADPDTLFTVGNFIPDTDGVLKFRPSINGKFKIHEIPEEGKRNNVRKRGSMFEPMNTAEYVIGIDPYSHSKVNRGTGSMGAAYVFRRYSILDPENTHKFIAQYIHRPPTVRIFYEDMRRLCHFYGAPMLFENQKQGVKEYFEEIKYNKFMIWLPLAKQSGIASSTPAKQELAETTELYIEDHTNKVPFKELIDDWIDFDLDDTEKYDAAMAAGWTLVADKILSKRHVRNPNTDTLSKAKAFRRNRAG